MSRSRRAGQPLGPEPPEEVCHDRLPAHHHSRDHRDRSVRRAGAAATSVRTTDTAYVAAGPGGATVASRIVTFAFGILQALLILRIILLLLVANPGNDIVSFDLQHHPAVRRAVLGMFSLNRVEADQGSVLDVAAIVALIGWTLVEALDPRGDPDLLATPGRGRVAPVPTS